MDITTLVNDTKFAGDIRSGLSPDLIHKEYGVPREVAREAARRLRGKGQVNLRSVPSEDDITFGIPESTYPLHDKWLRLNYKDGWDNCLIMSDLHIPKHHAPTIEKALNLSRRYGIKRLALIGDTMDGGQFHPKRGEKQHHHRRWQEDAELLSVVMKVIQKQITEQTVIVPGNHDWWFAKHMRGQVDHSWMMSNLFHEFGESILWSDYEHCELETSGGETWKLLHGCEFRGNNALGVAKDLASKFLCNILMGHQHQIGDGRDRSGKFRCVVLGGCHDERRFDYVNHSPSSKPRMNRSFAVLKDGELIHVTD